MTSKEQVNILLVDDQPAKLLSYETILHDLGENLLKATSATQALECLLHNEVAVILVDVCMPELDGYALASMIRDHPRFQRTSIIFVSAVLMTDFDLLRGYQCGAVDYLPVPVVPEILRAKVSVFADLYRKTRQLERLTQELEARVSERTAALEASTAQLREADVRKDQYIATLAHELRNPLAPILSSTQLLRLDGLEETQKTWARDVIERQVGHMVRLLDDLMDMSRITRGLVTLQRQSTPLGAIVSGAVEAVRPSIEGKGQVLEVEVSDDSVVLDIDRTRLSQVLGNLLNNAAKFTPRGGRIRLTAARIAHDEVVIAVADTGAGFAAEMQGKLFEPFSQLHQGHGGPPGGLGLGLSLVRRFTEMHGGRVSAHSEGLGKGSEFTVRLPITHPMQRETAVVAALPPSPLSEPIGRERLRVVVGDDNTDAANALASLLTVLGHDVRTAYDGAATVALVEQDPADVVVLDLGMPGMDGYEAARRIRACPRGESIFLVAVTGWGQPQDRARTKDAGFDAHLVKPVGMAAVAKALDASLVRRGQAAGGERQSDAGLRA